MIACLITHASQFTLIITSGCVLGNCLPGCLEKLHPAPRHRGHGIITSRATQSIRDLSHHGACFLGSLISVCQHTIHAQITSVYSAKDLRHFALVCKVVLRFAVRLWNKNTN